MIAQIPVIGEVERRGVGEAERRGERGVRSK